jgi:ABC-type uncharacterized transport system ATPase subunit
MLVGGREQDDRQSADAHALGLGMVYQHFTLVPAMTVAENLVLARDDVPAVIDWRKERAELEGVPGAMPFRLPLMRKVSAISAGEKQKLRDPQAALSEAALPDPGRADLGADAGRGRRGAGPAAR